MSWRGPRDIAPVTESAEAAAARLRRDVRHARRAVLVGAASVALFWSLIVVLPDRLPAVVTKLVLVPLAVAAIVGLVAAPVLYLPVRVRGQHRGNHALSADARQPTKLARGFLTSPV